MPSAMTTSRFLTVLMAAALLAGCRTRSQQVATPTAAAPPATSPRYFNPQTITIKLTNSVVFIDGEVSVCGRFDWTPEMTLTNLIALAGGFTDFANRARLEVRHYDGSIERYNYSRIRNGLTNNPALKVNDLVYVPRRRWF